MIVVKMKLFESGGKSSGRGGDENGRAAFSLPAPVCDLAVKEEYLGVGGKEEEADIRGGHTTEEASNPDQKWQKRYGGF